MLRGISHQKSAVCDRGLVHSGCVTRCSLRLATRGCVLSGGDHAGPDTCGIQGAAGPGDGLWCGLFRVFTDIAELLSSIFTRCGIFGRKTGKGIGARWALGSGSHCRRQSCNGR